MRTTSVTASALAVTLAAALQGAPAVAADKASAELAGPGGEPMGTVELTEGPHGVLISVNASGLPEGAHGFHIHQTGSCTPDFEAAGDHFSPDEHGHGFLADGGYHAGDLPNLRAGTDGVARADYFTDRISLAEDEPDSVFDNDGSAIIVHENPDSYGDEAGAGGRIACGVITAGQ